jgi:hypothetical protein
MCACFLKRVRRRRSLRPTPPPRSAARAKRLTLWNSMSMSRRAAHVCHSLRGLVVTPLDRPQGHCCRAFFTHFSFRGGHTLQRTHNTPGPGASGVCFGSTGCLHGAAGRSAPRNARAACCRRRRRRALNSTPTRRRRGAGVARARRSRHRQSASPLKQTMSRHAGNDSMMSIQMHLALSFCVVCPAAVAKTPPSSALRAKCVVPGPNRANAPLMSSPHRRTREMHLSVSPTQHERGHPNVAVRVLRPHVHLEPRLKKLLLLLLGTALSPTRCT